MGIEVGTQFLNLSTNTNGTVSKKRTIIDSGTTLAYLPDAIYKPLVNEVIFLMHYTISLNKNKLLLLDDASCILFLYF